MSEDEKDDFEAAYKVGGVAACRQLNNLQKNQGRHDMRIKLREKEITHEAIVELADRLIAIEKQMSEILAIIKTR